MLLALASNDATMRAQLRLTTAVPPPRQSIRLSAPTVASLSSPVAWNGTRAGLHGGVSNRRESWDSCPRGVHDDIVVCVSQVGFNRACRTQPDWKHKGLRRRSAGLQRHN